MILQLALLPAGEEENAFGFGRDAEFEKQLINSKDMSDQLRLLVNDPKSLLHELFEQEDLILYSDFFGELDLDER